MYWQLEIAFVNNIFMVKKNVDYYKIGNTKRFA